MTASYGAEVTVSADTDKNNRIFGKTCSHILHTVFTLFLDFKLTLNEAPAVVSWGKGFHMQTAFFP